MEVPLQTYAGRLHVKVFDEAGHDFRRHRSAGRDAVPHRRQVHLLSSPACPIVRGQHVDEHCRRAYTTGTLVRASSAVFANAVERDLRKKLT